MPPPPPEAPAPTLPDELLEEVFLRLPPDEPAWLLRASVANKHWFGLLTGARFRGRYRELHGSPPMLGFLYSWGWDSRPKKEDPFPLAKKKEDPFPGFVSTTNFSARIPQDKDWVDDHKDWIDEASQYSVWDCRHGRVLLCNRCWSPPLFVVWDPKTGSWREREIDLGTDLSSQGAAVLCAERGCDHRACHEGPFRVVLVSLDDGLEDDADGTSYVFNSMSSPETGEWRKHHFGPHDLPAGFEVWSETPHDLDLPDHAYIQPRAPALVDDALHFILSYTGDGRVGILKYDLGIECLSVIDAPLTETYIARSDVIVIAMEDGSLGFARVNELTLNLWSRQMGSEGVETWTQRIVINFKDLLPIRNPEKRLRLIGSVEGCDIVFVTTDLGIYQIHLKSLHWKKIWKREKYRALFPYMRF